MTNTRFEAIAEGLAQFETAAPEIIIDWNPEVQDGTITFNLAKYLMINSEIRYEVPAIRSGSMVAGISQNFHRRFAPTGLKDPVTNADLDQVSLAGLMLIAKAMVDVLHNEEHAPVP